MLFPHFPFAFFSFLIFLFFFSFPILHHFLNLVCHFLRAPLPCSRTFCCPVRNPQNVDLLDPKSGLFEPHPPPLTLLQKNPFLVPFVAKAGGHTNYDTQIIVVILKVTSRFFQQRPWIIGKIIMVVLGSHMPNMNYEVYCGSASVELTQ